MPEKFRVLVVDDHELIRQGVRSLFDRSPEFDVCGEAADGIQAIEQVRRLNPHVVILDISMPNMGGLEAAVEIRLLAPTTKIAMLTMHDSGPVKEQAAKAGAHGFVTKSQVSKNLIETVTVVLKPAAN